MIVVAGRFNTSSYGRFGQTVHTTNGGAVHYGYQSSPGDLVIICSLYLCSLWKASCITCL